MLRREWPLYAAWGISVASLALVAYSFVPATPLAERPGFVEAVAAIGADPPDLVVVWPPEQAAALAALPAELMASDAVPLEHESARRYVRIAVLAPAGVAPPRELAQAAPAAPRRFGDVEVSRFSYPPRERVAWDLRSDLGRARVTLRGQDGELACDLPRRGGGWSCPGRPEWNHVAPATLTVEGAPFACVWVHPVSGRALVIEVDRIPLAERLELRAALSDDAAATPGGADVVVELQIDGVASQSLTVGGPGMRRLVVPTPGRGEAGVRLVITTAHDGRRHLGVDLRVVDGP
ncbi:MAG: hypothetical protein HYZ27_07450 [Deltaproteobacteria bacterium]|nr:hypothetical protein [Deltaproteobacteria bacterium]